MHDVTEPGMAQRAHVVVGVGAEHRDVTSAEPRHRRHVGRRRAVLARIARLTQTSRVVSRPDQEDVAGLDAHALRLLGGFEVLGHDTLAGLEPAPLDRGHVEEHAAAHDPVAKQVHRFDLRALARRDQVRGAAVVHLALPEVMGQRVDVGDRVHRAELIVGAPSAPVAEARDHLDHVALGHARRHRILLQRLTRSWRHLAHSPNRGES